jgi:hypothetical protein
VNSEFFGRPAVPAPLRIITSYAAVNQGHQRRVIRLTKTIPGAQMLIKTARDREVNAIVAHDRAVEVANLLLGKLNRPMRRIFPEEYRSLPRRNLRSGKASLRDGRGEELEGFCERNFGTTNVDGLAGLYERLYEHASQVRLPLKEFATLIGQPQEGVLRGAPRHSTIAISPWGLQTEYPEMHLVRDMAVAFNSALSIDDELKQHEGTPWAKAKRDEVRKHIGDLNTRAAFHRRMCVLSCFNLIEAYINGVAWEFTESHDISGLSKNKQDVLTSGQASILDKVIKIPEIVTGRSPGPLSQEKDPLKTFKEIIKPFRDSIVHASPFSAPARFGGYDKLSKVYELTLQTVRSTVDLTVDIIGQIHQFLARDGKSPEWLPARGNGGRFEVERLL